jgi:GNAT superfamily N-acetyltransferase
VRALEWELITQVHEKTARVAYAHIFAAQPFPRDQTIDRWHSFPGEVLVAEQESMIIGFAAFDERELHALYILPEFQGQGIGLRLLRAAGSVSRLWVLKENHLARRFYEACGWTTDGEERPAFGATEVLYRRPAAARGTQEPEE